jgi:hypothetical protein
MTSEWPTVRRRLRAAAIRDAVLLALVYAVPRLRRFRRWYWRGLLGAALLGAAIGLAGANRDRHSVAERVRSLTRARARPAR